MSLCLSGVETEKLIHTEADIAASSTSLSLHHFHLLHGDFVQMKLTATNNAEGKTSLRSDGFTVDLTDPILQHLVDGPTLSKDMQYTVSVHTHVCTHTRTQLWPLPNVTYIPDFLCQFPIFFPFTQLFLLMKPYF